MTEPINAPQAQAPVQGDPPVTPAPGPSRLPAVTVALAVLVLLADQASKQFAIERLTGRGRVEVLGDLFGFHLVTNSGAAFSIATGATWVLTSVALVVVVVIIRISRRLGSRGWTLALGLVLGGALGNLGDRLFRPPAFFHGHVIDFLELPHWPIFNLADVSINVGAVLIALLSLRGIGIDGRRLTAATPATPATAPMPASTPTSHSDGTAAPND
jgi:signal peptidase II